MSKPEDPFADAIEAVRKEATRISKQYAPQLQNIITEAAMAIAKDGLRKQMGNTAKEAKPEAKATTNAEEVKTSTEYSSADSKPAADKNAEELALRLRTITQLHSDGVITDEEFNATKQAILARF